MNRTESASLRPIVNLISEVVENDTAKNLKVTIKSDNQELLLQYKGSLPTSVTVIKPRVPRQRNTANKIPATRATHKPANSQNNTLIAGVIPGSAIKHWREKHNLTQAQVAGKLDVTSTCIAYWENGKSKANTKTSKPARKLGRLMKNGFGNIRK